MQKHQKGLTFYFDSVEEAYSGGISLLATNDAKEPNPLGTETATIPFVYGFSLKIILRFKVDNFAGVNSNADTALYLFNSAFFKDRKYFVCVCLKHDKIYIVVQDLKLKKHLFSGFFRKT